jgi:hypothetical protein
MKISSGQHHISLNAANARRRINNSHRARGVSQESRAPPPLDQKFNESKHKRERKGAERAGAFHLLCASEWISVRPRRASELATQRAATSYIPFNHS